MAEKIFEFSSAVRGFYYYRKYWQPQLDDELYCQHELENPFDFFALKIYIKNTGVTAGHLPTEISKATKSLLDRGATAFIKLYSTNYCHVEIQMPPTLKNREIIDLYNSMIDLSCDSPKNNLWLDRFFRQAKRSRVLLQHVDLQREKRRK